jgi:HK97 family phage portal protein
MLTWLKSLPARLGGLRRRGFKVTRIEDMFGGIFANLPLSQFRNYESYLQAGSKQIWATWKACDIVGKVAMDTPMKVTRAGGDGTPVTSVPDLSRLLLTPNDQWTFAEMLYLFVFHMKLTGNAYWAKDEPNLAGDRPRRLFPLNPKNVTIVVDGRLGITGYIYRINGATIPYDVEEVIHFRNPHPDNPYYGLGDIEAGQDLFQEFLNREGYSSRFWRNGASPSGVLICEEQITDKTAFEEAKAKWQAQYGGVKNSGKTAWLTGKWSYQKLGLTMLEMQNIDGARFNIENIFHMHGVPLSVAGIREAANYATAQIDELIFRRYTVKPLLKLFTDTLQSDLVLGFGANLQLLADVAGLTDLNSVVANYVPLFDRGVLSINELRVAAGLAPIADDPLFDQHYLNAGLVPLELAGVQAADPNAQAAARGIVQRFTEASLGNGTRP